MCIAANKVPGVRAAVAHDCFIARIAREQHHCNVMCLAAELTRDRDLDKVVREFLSASPAGGRHARQVEKVGRIEQPSNEAKLAAALKCVRELEARLARPGATALPRAESGEGGGRGRAFRRRSLSALTSPAHIDPDHSAEAYRTKVQ
jgi:hypothetical protein